MGKGQRRNTLISRLRDSAYVRARWAIIFGLCASICETCDRRASDRFDLLCKLVVRRGTVFCAVAVAAFVVMLGRLPFATATPAATPTVTTNQNNNMYYTLYAPRNRMQRVQLRQLIRNNLHCFETTNRQARVSLSCVM